MSIIVVALCHNWIIRVCFWVFYGLFFWINICLEILTTSALVNFDKGAREIDSPGISHL